MMNEWERARLLAERLKEQYPVGTKVKLIHMGNDPRPVPCGTIGTVRAVDDMGTIHCTFENGRSLGLINGEDSFQKLVEEEVEEICQTM